MHNLRLLPLVIGSISAIVLFMTATTGSAAEIDDLKRQVQRMMQRIEATRASAPATSKKLVTSGKENFNLAISGQANRAVLYADLARRPSSSMSTKTNLRPVSASSATAAPDPNLAMKPISDAASLQISH